MPALLLLAGCGDGGSSSTKGLPRPSSPGAKAVASAGCTGCHRIGSAGSGGPGPELTHVGSSLKLKDVEQILVDPPPGMRSFADLPASKRRTIAAYISSLK